MPQAASTLTVHEGLSLAISAAGFVAVIATILLLLRQTRELSRQTSHIADSARADAFDRVQAQMFIIDQLFVTHPELRPYFYEGKPPADDQLLRQRLLAAAEMVLDVFEVIVLHQKYFVGVWPGGTWEVYMRRVFTHSPVLHDYLDANADWYPTELTEIMRRSSTPRPAHG